MTKAQEFEALFVEKEPRLRIASDIAVLRFVANNAALIAQALRDHEAINEAVRERVHASLTDEGFR
jgi:hypothetical protein